MTALGMVLSSLGIKITDEHRQQIEVLIPQIPARVVQAVEAINASIAKVNELAAAVERLEAKIDSLQKELEHGRQQPSDSGGPGIDAPGGSDTGPRYLNGNPAKRKRAAGTGTN